MPMNEDVEFNKVRWRARRGMMELDVLLARWLERRWRQSPMAQRAVFLQLLDCEDDRLWRWLSGRESPDDPGLAALVDDIRNLPVRA